MGDRPSYRVGRPIDHFAEGSRSPRRSSRRLGARLAEGGKDFFGGIGVLGTFGDILYSIYALRNQEFDLRATLTVLAVSLISGIIGYGLSKFSRRSS